MNSSIPPPPPPDNPLARALRADPQSPRTLISLWDMIRALAGYFVAFNQNLDNYEALFSRHRTGPDLLEEDRRGILEFLKASEPYLHQLKMVATLSRARSLKLRLLHDPHLRTCTNSVIQAELQALRRELCNELMATEFALIPTDKAAYFERDNLFGEEFHKNADQKINDEIKAAGNCLAAELNTAAVFHLMRAAEFGLRHLVADMAAKGVPISISCPIEFSTWGKVIDAVDVELRRIKSTPVAAAREADLHFYSLVSSEFRAIQYLWRDPVMHARFEEPHEAENAFRHVRRFMQELAKRLPLK